MNHLTSETERGSSGGRFYNLPVMLLELCLLLTMQPPSSPNKLLNFLFTDLGVLGETLRHIS